MGWLQTQGYTSSTCWTQWIIEKEKKSLSIPTRSWTFLFFLLKSLFAMPLHPPHPLSSSPHLFLLSIIHKRKKVHGVGKGWGLWRVGCPLNTLQAWVTFPKNSSKYILNTCAPKSLPEILKAQCQFKIDSQSQSKKRKPIGQMEPTETLEIRCMFSTGLCLPSHKTTGECDVVVFMYLNHSEMSVKGKGRCLNNRHYDMN